MKVTKRIKILRDILKYADISTVDRDIIESVIVGLEVDICLHANRLQADSFQAGQLQCLGCLEKKENCCFCIDG